MERQKNSLSSKYKGQSSVVCEMKWYHGLYTTFIQNTNNKYKYNLNSDGSIKSNLLFIN